MKRLAPKLILGIGISCIAIVAIWLWVVRRSWQRTPESKVPADTLITLERTGCYGFCPSYTLTLTADGTVVFNATAYWVKRNGAMQGLKESGVVFSKVSQDTLRQLVSEFDKANYFSLKDGYLREGCPDVSTDSPSAYTSIQINGHRKAISHYLGCVFADANHETYPRELTALENRIDEIVNTQQWMQ